MEGGTVRDLGGGGLCIETGAPFGASNALHIRLDLLETSIEAKGEIAWIDPQGRAGVRFLRLPEMSRLRLTEWLFRRVMGRHTDLSAKATRLSRSMRSVAAENVSSPSTVATATFPGPSGCCGDAFHLSAVVAANDEITPAELELDAVLNLIAARTQFITGATGAAIAVATTGAMVCRATGGIAVPDLGVRLETKSGLSAECLRTGTTVRCEDTETDGRVDLANCRRLGVRSAIIMPAYHAGRIVSLLGVFSTRSHAFDAYDVAALQQMAECVAEKISCVGQRGAKQTLVA